MDLSDFAPEGQGPALSPRDAEIEGLRLEIERLKAEQEELRSGLPNPTRADRGRRGGARNALTALLAAVCCVLVFLSLMTVWIHQTVISTSGFVSTMAPIVQRPEVASSISAELTDQLFNAVNVQSQVEKALPAQVGFLAAPLSSAAHGFIQGQVQTILRSPQFQPVWTAVLRTAHSQVIAALRGQTNVIRLTNDTVVLNLLPLVNAALQQIQSVAPGLLGRNITIPPITSGEVPAQIRSALSSALGVQLPADFAQIELARSSSIQVAQNSVRLLDVLYWLLPLVTALLLATTLWQSSNRRRTLLQILIGTAIALVFEKRAESWTQARIVATLNPNNRAAGGAVVKGVLHSLGTAVTWTLVVALVAVVLLLITGPYQWARSLRQSAFHLSRDLARAVAAKAADEPAAVWIIEHLRWLQAGGAVIGGLLLWVVPGWWFFVIVAVVAGYEIALWYVAKRLTSGPGPSAQPPASKSPGSEPSHIGG